MDSLVHKSPLSSYWSDGGPAKIEAGTVTITERPERTKILLRGDGSDGFIKAIVVATGQPVPTEAGELTGDDPCCMLIGTNEWLIASDSVPDLQAKLEQALGSRSTQLFDMTEAWVAIELSGPEARTILSRGCDLDLHTRNFGHGKFASTSIARAPVILYSRGRSNNIDVYVDRSLAMDLWLWFRNAAGDLTV